MFDTTDIEPTEKNWIAAKDTKTQQTKLVIEEFNKFINLWEKYQTVSNKKAFEYGGYIIANDIDRCSYKRILVAKIKNRFLRKRKLTSILDIYYDYAFALFEAKSAKERKGNYGIVSLQYYDAGLNPVYEMLFTQLKFQYSEYLEKDTDAINHQIAYTQLSFEEN